MLKEIRIPYKGKEFSIYEFSQILKIPEDKLRKLYDKGFTTGEQIIEIVEIITGRYDSKNTLEDTKITYKGREFSIYAFSQIVKAPENKVRKLYSKGYTTGEQIVNVLTGKLYAKNTLEEIKIPYKGKEFGIYTFSQIIKAPEDEVRKLYSEGHTTGEQIIDALTGKLYTKNTFEETKITYKGREFGIYTFSQLIKATEDKVRKLYYNGFTTGEQIAAALTGKFYVKNTLQGTKPLEENKSFKETKPLEETKSLEENKQLEEIKPFEETKIPYKGKEFSIYTFSRIIKVPEDKVRMLYSKGYITGEQIVEILTDKYGSKKISDKAKVFIITYEGEEYSIGSFSRKVGIFEKAVADMYHKDNIRTGEEMIRVYESRRAARHEANYIIRYNGNIYNKKQFSEITGIDYTKVFKYCKEGITDGEEIIKRVEDCKKKINSRVVIEIPFMNTTYSPKQFSELTGMSIVTINKYVAQGYTTGEEILDHCFYVKHASEHKIKVLIPYQGKTYNVSQFCELTGIEKSIIYEYRKKGITDGEEIIARYNSK